VEFCVMGLGTLQGALTIRAAYTPVSPTRVDISFTEATLVCGVGVGVREGGGARGDRGARRGSGCFPAVAALLARLQQLWPGCSSSGQGPAWQACAAGWAGLQQQLHQCSVSRDSVGTLLLQVPRQLQQLFQANYDLLLSIFNPDGWLEITYLDDSLRVGRDDKRNIFLLERA
jgi:hypothetical protein